MSQSTYDKIPDYIESLFIVFRKFNEKAKDTRQKMIALTIYNYVRYMSKQYNVDLSTIIEDEMINLIPIFEYISHENIEFYDFSKINMNDVDITKKEDLERFVLSHVYYITQSESL
jgi:predicted molibdopterin-dependent oxidoreductase YjgC